jgi:EAL domain-containing protein (putative c-di-GMP-specific phosphodiesterase class I)
MIRRWEGCGYIGTVDVSVLKQAMVALDVLHHSLMVSVNVSMVTLNTDRARYLRHLDTLGDKAKRLIVEVTNTASQSDPTVLLQFARECAARNVRLALDDFVPDRPKSMATVLSLVRPKLIKLDRKAVSNAFQNVMDTDIRELVEAAAGVNARVVAQGIDSQEKLDWAFGLGVRYVQGFLVGHPRQFPLLDTQASFRDLENSVLPEDIAA